MKRFLLLAAFSLVSLASTASAQSPVEITVDDQNRLLKPDGYTEFHVTVKNVAPGLIFVRAVRTQNDLPDGTWTSSICSGQLCYPSHFDTTDAVQLEPGQITDFRLNVQAGTTLNVTARMKLRFEAGLNNEGTEKEFVVTTAAAGVRDDRVANVSIAYPNPASSIATLPVTIPVREGATLRVFDALGRQVMERSVTTADKTSIDVTTLVNGSYIYEITSGEKRSAGRFVVAH